MFRALQTLSSLTVVIATLVILPDARADDWEVKYSKAENEQNKNQARYGKVDDVKTFVAYLEKAIAKNDAWAVRYLLTQKKKHNLDFDLNSQDDNGDALTHRLARQNQGEILKVIFEHDANPNLQNDRKESPLIAATLAGATKSIAVLLARKDVDLELKDENDHTALAAALFNENEAITQKLIKRGANKDISIRELGKSSALLPAIDWAIKRESIRALTALLPGKKALAQYRDKNAFTLLHKAALAPSEKLTKYLLKQGVSPYLANSGGKYAFELAANNRHWDIYTAYLKTDPSLVNFKDVVGNTVAHNAVTKLDFELLEQLIKAGADLTIKNDANQTPRDVFTKLEKETQVVAETSKNKDDVARVNEALHKIQVLLTTPVQGVKIQKQSKFVADVLTRNYEFLTKTAKGRRIEANDLLKYVSEQRRGEYSLLDYAIFTHDTALIGRLLKADPKLAEIATANKRSPLNRAVELNNKKVLAVFSAAGIDLNVEVSHRPLVQNLYDDSRLDLLALIIKHAPDPCMISSLTPLIVWGIQNNDKSMIKKSLDAGCSVTAKDHLGENAFFKISNITDPEIVDLLFKQKDVAQAMTDQNEQGDTALHVALGDANHTSHLNGGTYAWHYLPDLARRMIDAGADVNFPTRSGYRPLSAAVEAQDAALVADLLKVRADPDVPYDNVGISLFCGAIQRADANTEIIELLLQYGGLPSEPCGIDFDGSLAKTAWNSNGEKNGGKILKIFARYGLKRNDAVFKDAYFANDEFKTAINAALVETVKYERRTEAPSSCDKNDSAVKPQYLYARASAEELYDYLEKELRKNYKRFDKNYSSDYRRLVSMLDHRNLNARFVHAAKFDAVVARVTKSINDDRRHIDPGTEWDCGVVKESSRFSSLIRHARGNWSQREFDSKIAFFEPTCKDAAIEDETHFQNVTPRFELAAYLKSDTSHREPLSGTKLKAELAKNKNNVTLAFSVSMSAPDSKFYRGISFDFLNPESFDEQIKNGREAFLKSTHVDSLERFFAYRYPDCLKSPQADTTKINEQTHGKTIDAQRPPASATSTNQAIPAK